MKTKRTAPSVIKVHDCIAFLATNILQALVFLKSLLKKCFRLTFTGGLEVFIRIINVRRGPLTDIRGVNFKNAKKTTDKHML